MPVNNTAILYDEWRRAGYDLCRPGVAQPASSHAFTILTPALLRARLRSPAGFVTVQVADLVSGAALGLEEFDVFVVGQQEEFFGQS